MTNSKKESSPSGVNGCVGNHEGEGGRHQDVGHRHDAHGDESRPRNALPRVGRLFPRRRDAIKAHVGEETGPRPRQYPREAHGKESSVRRCRPDLSYIYSNFFHL